MLHRILPRSSAATIPLLAIAVLALACAGCGRNKNPYSEGYKAGWEKGDMEKSLEDRSQRQWWWEESGNTLCPYPEGAEEWRYFKSGYVDGYRHGTNGVYALNPPEWPPKREPLPTAPP